jgi:ferredoxin
MSGRHFKINVSELDTEFTCSEQDTVFDALTRRNSGVIVNGCRGGGCGVCKVEVMSGVYEAFGTMSSAHVSSQDLAEGRVLACKIHPRGDIILKVVGKMKNSAQLSQYRKN